MFKYIAGIIAFILLVAFVAPVFLKLKDLALAIVLVIGLGLMAVDLWQSFREKSD